MILKPLSLDISLPSQDNQNDIEFDITECLVDPNEEVPEPTPIIAFEHNGYTVPIFTENNKSLIKGQAKSRKSTLIKAIGATIVSKGYYNEGGKLKSYYHRNELSIIDTEQGKYHCYKAVKMIQRLSGESINYYRVAGKTIPQKKYLVEQHLKTHPNCGVMVIDNIVHFLLDFNSATESRELESWIDYLVETYNCHIILVLHENGSDSGLGKAKGHLGSLLENTCETTIRVRKDPDNKGQSIVSGALTRNGDFEDFIISMDYQGVPYISVPSDGKPMHKTIKI
ncbi:hypothetical protein [Epilithonimonas sp.]|uniref:hypothetical protein n=1 Tax=Epilithonimonas sp. TaxID=2894511 RepID=UPI0035B222BC